MQIAKKKKKKRGEEKEEEEEEMYVTYLELINLSSQIASENPSVSEKEEEEEESIQ